MTEEKKAATLTLLSQLIVTTIFGFIAKFCVVAIILTFFPLSTFTYWLMVFGIVFGFEWIVSATQFVNMKKEYDKKYGETNAQ